MIVIGLLSIAVIEIVVSMILLVIFGVVAGGTVVVRRVVPVFLVKSVAKVLLSWVIVIGVFSIFVVRGRVVSMILLNRMVVLEISLGSLANVLVSLFIAI